MLKLETNIVIITQNIVWLNKLYGDYMGITKTKTYRVIENENQNSNLEIELIHKEEDNESILNQETANKNQKLTQLNL
jgi:hypothetical protein